MIKNKLLYFISGMAVGFFLGCASFLIFISIIAIAGLFHRKKIIKIHKEIKITTYQWAASYKRFIAPFIKNQPRSRKEKINVFLKAELIKEIEAYCKWANIDNMGLFIETIAGVVFDKDKDWKAFQGISKKAEQRNVPLINRTNLN